MSVESIEPPTGCRSITQSDGTDDPMGPFRAVWVEVAGDLKVTFKDGSTGVFPVLGSTRFEGHIKRIWSTGTTATVTLGLR